jgi:hypothetical protein
MRHTAAGRRGGLRAFLRHVVRARKWRLWISTLLAGVLTLAGAGSALAGFVQSAKLTGGEEVREYFGRSAALSADGNTALVGGALVGGPASFEHHGAVWAFTRSGGIWTRGQEVTEPGGSMEGYFGGFGVALSGDGNTALIGSLYKQTAWVFTRSGSTWTPQGEALSGGEAVPPDGFGGHGALSADGDTALIAGPQDNRGKGAVWVFTRSGSNWTQQGKKLVGEGEIGNAEFGWSVALSADGNTALVGGPFDGEGGSAWVFARSGSTWAQQGPKLTGMGEVGSGWFGVAVALSADGNTALIGGNFDHYPHGAAWVFTRSGGVWTQQGPKLAAKAKGIDLGNPVALSADGSTALIGGGEARPVQVFGRSGSTWTWLKKRAFAPAGEENEFGHALGLSADGNTALVGSYLGRERPGAAWVFTCFPEITKVLPKKGLAAGGTEVHIAGACLGGATALRFGSASATRFTNNSSTSITAVAPPAPPGTVDVTVVTGQGTSPVSTGDHFKYVR